MIYLLLIPIFLAWSFALTYIAHYLIDSNNKSSLSPYFEVVMTLCFTMLWHNHYFHSYFILLSALGITIQTDFCCMLISRFASLYLLPIPIGLTLVDLLPIHILDSIIASIIGYGLFYGINKIFYFFSKKDGLGQGDFELMAFIGAYTGLLGVWFTILCGSILGSLTACAYMLYTNKRLSHIPFGPFLSLSSIIFVLFQNHIIYLFL